MKSRYLSHPYSRLLVIAFTMQGFSSSAQAADVVKLSSGGLNTATSWDGGALPGATNTGLFNSTTVTSGVGASFDASGTASSLTWGAMKVTDIAGPLTFTSVATVSMGALGGTIVDLSTAAADVTFNSGTVRLSPTTIGGSIDVTSGRTLTVNNMTNNSGTRTYTFTGGGNVVVNGGTFLSGGATSAIVSNASLTLNGGGTLLLSGSVTLQSGSLNFGNDSALGTKEIIATGGTITASGGARTLGNGFTLSNTVTFGGANNLAVTGAISGVGTLAKDGAGTLTLSNTNAYTGAIQVTGGTLLVDGAGSINTSSGLTLNGSNVKLLQTSSVAGTAPIALTQATLDGTGTVGAVTVAAAGAASTKVVANGNLTSNTALTLGSLTLDGTATLTPRLGGASSPGLVVTGGLTLAGGVGSVVVNPTVAGGLVNGTYQLISYGGAFTGAANKFTLAPGLLSGRQSSTFASTAPSAGFITLQITGDGPVWSGAASNFLTQFAPNAAPTAPLNLALKTAHTTTNFWTGDVLEFNNTYQIGATVTNVTQTTINIAGGAANAGGIAATSLIFNNTINYSITSTTGKGITAGSLIKNGTGSVTISTANSYTGATSVIAGRVNLQNSSALGASSAATVASGAALELQGSLAFSAVPLTLNGTGLTASPAGALRNVSGTNSYDGLVTLGSSATIRSEADSLALTNVGAITGTGSGFALTLDGTGAGSIASAIATGTGTLIKDGLGTWTLTGANSYTGGTTVKNGILVLGTGGSMAAPLTLGDASNTSGVFQLGDSTAAVNATVTGLTTAGAGTANAVVGGNDVANSVLTVNSSSVSSYNGLLGSGIVEASAANKLGFTKSGVGTLTLSSNNTHTGNTSVTGGTLVLTGNNSNGASATLIGNGGTLQLQANAGNTLAGVSSAVGSTGGLALAAPTVSTQTVGLQLRSDSAVTFANSKYNNNGRLAMTVNIDVDTLTPVTTGGALTIGAISGITGATVNVTGNTIGTGSSLIIGASSGSTGSTQNLTFNPTTANVSLGGYNATGGTINLNLGGTSPSNFVTGVLRNGGGLLNVVKNNTGTWTLSGINTYSGNTTVDVGELILADDAGLTFVPGLNGVSNKVTGAATATLNGDFTFNLVGAEIVNGNNWTIVDVATKSFGPSFTVVDFTESANVWTKVDGTNTWTFTEATGVLSLNASTSSAYGAWALSKGLDGTNNGPTQDNGDFDGVPNSLEFVLGGNPKVSDPLILPDPSQDATNFYFTFNRADESEAEISLTFEWGSTLTGWTPVVVGANNAGSGAGVNITEDVPSLTVDTVVVTVPKSSASGGKLFGRLKAVK